MATEIKHIVDVSAIKKAQQRISGIVDKTPLQRNINLSEKYECSIFLKREDLQVVRSFKIRGAYNKIFGLSEKERQMGIVCASAGNHAQGVALSCAHLQIKGKIFMPNPTPNQKIEKVKTFGKEWVDIMLIGDSYDDAHEAAIKDSKLTNSIFVHPFDDIDVIAGQGTVAAEMLDQLKESLDYLLVAVGGGGLISGVGAYFKALSPTTKIIAVESSGANALEQSLLKGINVRLDSIDTFADGIAVKKIGDLNFSVCQSIVDEIVSVPEGKICSTILSLYNEEAIVVEPAGAVSVAALDSIRAEIKGKNIGIIICGGNNDIQRTQEIKERALLFEGKKHYFIINFPQRAGALKEFLNILGPDDDISHFQYTKKSSREQGPALVGIELKNEKDFDSLISRMKNRSINYEHINNNPMLFQMLV